MHSQLSVMLSRARCCTHFPMGRAGCPPIFAGHPAAVSWLLCMKLPTMSFHCHSAYTMPLLTSSLNASTGPAYPRQHFSVQLRSLRPSMRRITPPPARSHPGSQIGLQTAVGWSFWVAVRLAVSRPMLPPHLSLASKVACFPTGCSQSSLFLATSSA